MAPVRKASDALKGAATTAEEQLPITPEAEATPEAKPDAEAEAKAAAEAKQEAAEAEAAKAAEAEATAAADAAAAVEDVEEDEDGLIEAVVLFSMFNYFDEDGAHCGAHKGETVHVDQDTAKRGVKLGALKLKD